MKPYRPYLSCLGPTPSFVRSLANGRNTVRYGDRCSLGIGHFRPRDNPSMPTQHVSICISYLSISSPLPPPPSSHNPPSSPCPFQIPPQISCRRHSGRPPLSPQATEDNNEPHHRTRRLSPFPMVKAFLQLSPFQLAD